MSELENMVLKIRMMLAVIKSKEEQLDSQRADFQNQLLRIERYALYGNIDLDSSLLLMEEVENRLNHAEVALRHLRAIKRRAEEELECLELTRSIEEAKAELSSLRARNDKETLAEIRRLENFISEASKRASESIASH
jgi:hypothetical protein